MEIGNIKGNIPPVTVISFHPSWFGDIVAGKIERTYQWCKFYKRFMIIKAI